MAIEDWVRGRARSVPAHRPEQVRQLQFHWGKPPPAADPSTRILHGSLRGAEAARGVHPAAGRTDQRRAMYSVISMPKSTSVACGISQRISLLEG